MRRTVPVSDKTPPMISLGDRVHANLKHLSGAQWCRLERKQLQKITSSGFCFDEAVLIRYMARTWMALLGREREIIEDTHALRLKRGYAVAFIPMSIPGNSIECVPMTKADDENDYEVPKKGRRPKQPKRFKPSVERSILDHLADSEKSVLFLEFTESDTVSFSGKNGMAEKADRLREMFTVNNRYESRLSVAGRLIDATFLVLTS